MTDSCVLRNEDISDDISSIMDPIKIYQLSQSRNSLIEWLQNMYGYYYQKQKQKKSCQEPTIDILSFMKNLQYFGICSLPDLLISNAQKVNHA